MNVCVHLGLKVWGHTESLGIKIVFKTEKNINNNRKWTYCKTITVMMQNDKEIFNFAQLLVQSNCDIDHVTVPLKLKMLFGWFFMIIRFYTNSWCWWSAAVIKTKGRPQEIMKCLFSDLNSHSNCWLYIFIYIAYSIALYTTLVKVLHCQYSGEISSVMIHFSSITV